MPSLAFYASLDVFNHKTLRRTVQSVAKQGWILTERPMLADLLLFSIEGRPMHVGVALSATEFLHIQQGTNSVVGRMNRFWLPRLRGVYRYADSD